MRICPECKRASSMYYQACNCGHQFNGTEQHFSAAAPAPQPPPTPVRMMAQPTPQTIVQAPQRTPQPATDNYQEHPLFAMRGLQDLLEVFEDRVTIAPKGILGFLNKGGRGTKEIPFASIVAVQFKESGAVFSGYLQFTIPGGIESRGGTLAATKDENTFMFAGSESNAMARQIKQYIDGAVRRSRAPRPAAPAPSLSDELQKLAQLQAPGVLSEEEFRAAKKRLLG